MSNSQRNSKIVIKITYSSLYNSTEKIEELISLLAANLNNNNRDTNNKVSKEDLHNVSRNKKEGE